MALQSWLVGALWAFALVGLWSSAVMVRSWWQRLGVRLETPPGISILLVVRNAADGLEGLLRHLTAPDVFGWRPPLDYEVIVVDVHSSDDTPAILERMVRRSGALRVFRAPAVLPGGAGTEPPDPIRYGIFLCQGRAVLLLDLRSRGRWREAHSLLAALFQSHTGGVRTGGLRDGGRRRAHR